MLKTVEVEEGVEDDLHLHLLYEEVGEAVKGDLHLLCAAEEVVVRDLH